jgi:hypothetical protein
MYGGTRMNETLDNEEPNLIKVSRRKFIKLMALGGGAVVLSASGLSIGLLKHKKNQAVNNDIPVKNPAFREAPGDIKDHVVLYCQQDKDRYIAYDLNPTGYMVWQKCTEHSDFVKGVRKSFAQIASEIADKLDIETARSFVDLMYARGLAYSGTTSVKAYFVYEGRH